MNRFSRFLFTLQRLTIAALFLSLTASPAASCQQAQPEQSAGTKAGFVVPFELYRNHIYVKVRVNGSEALGFILDTGASLTTLSDKRAHELDLKLHNQQTINAGAGEGKTKIALTSDVRFSLGGKDVAAKNVLVLSFAELETSEGHRIDGVLGVDVFDQYVVKIDYEARAVTLYDPKEYVYSGAGDVISLKRTDNWVYVPVKVGVSPERSIESDFVVDTGSRLALSLNSPLVTAEHLLSDRKVLPSFGAGIGGEYRASIGRVQSIQLGSFVLGKPVVSFSTATQGANARNNAGALGGELLRRFTVIFDYRRKRMVLERNPRFEDLFEENMSGLILEATGDDLTTLRVLHVLADTPAAEAGFREGDILLEIDNHPAAVLNLERIEQMFKQEGHVYAVKVKRDNQVLQMTIRTQRLI